MNNKGWDIDRREYTLGILALIEGVRCRTRLAVQFLVK